MPAWWSFLSLLNLQAAEPFWHCHSYHPLKYIDHIDSLGRLAYLITKKIIHTNIPLCDIVPHLSVRVALKIARLHHLQIGSHVPKSENCRIFEGHNCIYCNVYSTVFAVVDSKTTRPKVQKNEKRSENGVTSCAINMKHEVVNLKSESEKRIDINVSRQNIVGNKKDLESGAVSHQNVDRSHRSKKDSDESHQNGARSKKELIDSDVSHQNVDRSKKKLDSDASNQNVARSKKKLDSDVSNQNVARSKKKLDSGASHRDVVFSKLPDTTPFPPTPIDNELSRRIINDFCVDSSPSAIEEAGCAVCSQLVSISQLTRLKGVKNMLHVLHVTSITRIERSDTKQYEGPVLDYACNQICNDCRQQVRNGKIPCYALANGLWLGAVPDVLSSLTYIERLLIAHVQVNSCFIRVASSGLRKMASHVVAFESPVPKLYQSLPPPVEDLDEVLAILFTGPCKPSEKEFNRTPLLVRRKKVANALEWLKLNHVDYADLDISFEELNRYLEHEPPVSIHYQHSLTNKVEEGTSVFDDAPDDGIEQGDCPFVVHGLTGDQLTTKSASALKGIALRHWNSRGAALAISHDALPQSMYNNPSLYSVSTNIPLVISVWFGRYWLD